MQTYIINPYLRKRILRKLKRNQNIKCNSFRLGEFSNLKRKQNIKNTKLGIQGQVKGKLGASEKTQFFIFINIFQSQSIGSKKYISKGRINLKESN